MMKFLEDATAAEIISLLQADTPLNEARKIFSFSSAGIEQKSQQRDPLKPIDVRREEFKAVLKIADAYGVPPESLMSVSTEKSAPIRFLYKNYRGEVRIREAFPIRFVFEANEWHTTPQWLLHATDAETGEFRSFAFADMKLIQEKVSGGEYVQPASCEAIEKLKQGVLKRKKEKPWYGEGDDSPKVLLTTDMVLSLIAAIEGQEILLPKKENSSE